MTKPTKYLINPNDPEQVQWLKEKLSSEEPKPPEEPKQPTDESAERPPGGNPMERVRWVGTSKLTEDERRAFDAQVRRESPSPFRRVLTAIGVVIILILAAFVIHGVLGLGNCSNAVGPNMCP